MCAVCVRCLCGVLLLLLLLVRVLLPLAVTGRLGWWAGTRERTRQKKREGRDAEDGDGRRRRRRAGRQAAKTGATSKQTITPRAGIRSTCLERVRS